MITFGQYLKQIREEKGLSQRKLAKISDISNTTIYRLEAGLLINPEIETLIKLANALNHPIDDLLAKANINGNMVSIRKEELPKDLQNIGLEYIYAVKELKEEGFTPEQIKNLKELKKMLTT